MVADCAARQAQDRGPWAKQHGVAPERIFVGEFGAGRRVAGAEAYLRDSIAAFEHFGWHRACYAFRKPEWDGKDYELGTAGLHKAYWVARDACATDPAAPHRRPNTLSELLSRSLRPDGD